jgi:hypothetical protein
MADPLRAKPGGDAIQVTIGDMAKVGVLQLRERYSGWDRRQLYSASAGHVLVYERL